MRYFVSLFLAILLLFMPFRSSAEIYIQEGVTWDYFYTVYQDMKARCPPDTAPNNFMVFKDGFTAFGALTCDACALGGCEYGSPWEGGYDAGGSAPNLPPPPGVDSDAARELEPDFSGIRGVDSDFVMTMPDGLMYVRHTEWPQWQFPLTNLMTNYESFDSYFRTNLSRTTDILSSGIALSNNLMARRIANLSNQISHSDSLNYIYHNETINRVNNSVAAHTANAAQYVLDEVSDHINTQNQFMAGEFIALGDAIDGISFTGDIDTTGLLTADEFAWRLLDAENKLWDGAFAASDSTVSRLGSQLGMQIGMFQGSLSGDLSSQFSNVNSNIQNVNSRVGELPSLIGQRHGEVMGRISQLEGGIMSAHGEVMTALAGIDGSGGGGLSPDEAAGLIGEYSGDDYVDGDAEGILGTEGLSLDDLEGDTIMLDSVAVDYFNFAPVSCYEPISINISVFGMDNTIEIDLTPLCSVFNIVGVLLFIASNLMAVRIVVGAF